MKSADDCQSIELINSIFFQHVQNYVRTSTLGYVLLAIGVAFLIGLAFFSRQFVGTSLSGEKYTPLVYNVSSLSTKLLIKSDYNFKPDDILWDETRAYARYTQEVARGEFLGANACSFNPYLKEGLFPKSFWYRDRLGPIILAGMMKIFGSISSAFIACDFIFPFFSGLVLLLLCRQFFKFTIGFSIMATVSTMMLSWTDLLHLRDIFLGQLPDGLVLLRTPYPQFSFLTFLLFMLSLTSFYQKPSKQALLWLSTIVLVNFYMYFYVWTIVFIMFGLYAALNSNKKLSEILLGSIPRYRFTFLAIVFIVIAGSFPVWGPLLYGQNTFNDTFLRVFGVYTHTPNWHQSLLILPFFILSIIFHNHSWHTRWIWLIFFSSALIALNQQIITGKLNQPGHWTSQLIEPLTVLFLFDFVFHYISKYMLVKKMMPYISSVMLILIFMQIYFVGYRGAVIGKPYNQIDPPFSELISFMNNAELRHDGFLSNDPYLETVLPAFITQKPLMPWYNDPLSNEDISLINNALTNQFGSIIGDSARTGSKHYSSLKFDDRKVLLVLNRQLTNYSAIKRCQIIFENKYFIVVRPMASMCART